MTKKRSHRVVVEITLEKADTEKRAVLIVQRAMESGYENSDIVHAETTTFYAKSFLRVFAAEKRKSIWLRVDP